MVKRHQRNWNPKMLSDYFWPIKKRNIAENIENVVKNAENITVFVIING